LQRDGSKAKVYQVRQVGHFLEGGGKIYFDEGGSAMTLEDLFG